MLGMIQGWGWGGEGSSSGEKLQMSDVMGQHQADLSKIETDGLIDLTDLSAKRANAQMTQHSQTRLFAI